MEEEWRSVPEYETFEVSNLGNIRHHKKKNNRKFKIDSSGYRRITLRKDGKNNSLKVHSLVMLAFIGPRPDGMVTNHIDGDKQNNCLSNLEYITVIGKYVVLNIIPLNYPVIAAKDDSGWMTRTGAFYGIDTEDYWMPLPSAPTSRDKA